jgi:hypothetical protein
MNPPKPGSTSIDSYQQLLQAALQTRQLSDTLSLVRVLVNDRALAGEVALKLLNMAFAIAARSGDVSAVLDRNGLPSRCTVLVYQPWFGVDYVELIRRGLTQGLLLPLFASVRTADARLIQKLTPANYLSFEHQGINLWSICRYNLALSERSMPENLSVRTPATFNAIRTIYAHAAALIDDASDFVTAYRPESALVAQGYHLIAAVMRRVCVLRGVRVVSLENTFHREKLLWEDVSGVAVNMTLAKNYYWRYTDAVSEKQARHSAERYLGSIQTFKSSEHTSPATNTTEIPKNKVPLIVYLGQVSTDASVLFGRRNFSSQVDAICAVAEYALEREVKVIVKLHPKEGPLHKVPEPFYRGLTSSWLEQDTSFQKAQKQLGDRLVVDTENVYNTYDLIRRADVCVTINSQSGLEALIHDKEVILCGDASFGALGFTHEAMDAIAVKFILDRILRDGLRCNDGLRCRKFFHIFTDYYCLPKNETSLLNLANGRPSYSDVGSIFTVPPSPDRSAASRTVAT